MSTDSQALRSSIASRRRMLGAPGATSIEIGGPRTRLMGILNVTPDSFYDGGRHAGVAQAVAHGQALVAAGADILDIGGESTRPGHSNVPAIEQIRRIEPVVRALTAVVAVPISVDTTRSEVAAAALDAGASWVNDTTAFGADPALADLCAARRCPVVLMHRFDPPRRPGDAPPPGRELVRSIATALEARVAFALSRGVERAQMVLDPGAGFGTLPEDNLAMHAFVDELRSLDLPLLFGTSRKSFLGHVTGRDADGRLASTAASVACLALAGVEILRVHDVAAMRDVVAVIDAVRAQTLRARSAAEAAT